MVSAFDTQFDQRTTEPAAAMVVGGGIGGMRAALDMADAGLRVYLIEQTPCLGGRVAQLGYMFPQHDCVLCRGTPDHGYGCTRPSISPAYIQQNQHPNIEILTNAHITDVGGQAGDFSVSLRQEPRYVDIERCISCSYCSEVCPVELPDSYQQGITMRKAIYKPSARAAPDAYVIDKGPYCEDCQKCVQVCPTQAIQLDEQPKLRTVEAGAIILALGFQTGLNPIGFLLVDGDFQPFKAFGGRLEGGLKIGAVTSFELTAHIGISADTGSGADDHGRAAVGDGLQAQKGQDEQFFQHEAFLV